MDFSQAHMRNFSQLVDLLQVQCRFLHGFERRHRRRGHGRQCCFLVGLRRSAKHIRGSIWINGCVWERVRPALSEQKYSGFFFFCLLQCQRELRTLYCTSSRLQRPRERTCWTLSFEASMRRPRYPALGRWDRMLCNTRSLSVYKTITPATGLRANLTFGVLFGDDNRNIEDLASFNL